MYSLVAYSPFTTETWDFEHERYPISPKGFRFSKLSLGSWRTGSFRSKLTDRSVAGNSCPSIDSFRRGNSISRKSNTNSSNTKNNNITSSSSENINRIVTTSGINSKSSNSDNIITTTTPSSSGIQKKICTVHGTTTDRPSLDSSDSSIDEDEDLYEFDIYEDERRYRPILKRTSKYGPLPIPCSPKCRGIWRIFGSYRKPQADGNPQVTAPSVVCSPADAHETNHPRTGVSSTVKGCDDPLPASLNNRCPKTGVSGDSSTVKGCISSLPESPKDDRNDPSSDCGYSSDEGIIGDIDWGHFQLMQSVEKEKKKVHFSDPLLTHIYRHSYKSYIPKDAAIVTMRL